MTEEKIKPGDQAIFPSRHARMHGPLHVSRIDRYGCIWVKERTIPYMPDQLVKLKPGQTVKQALIALVPANQRCEICGWRPAPERHFVTVPIPEAFTRVCMEDIAEIKKEIRKRVKDIVNQVFEEFKRKAER